MFPYSRVREGQRQFLEDARSSMANQVHLLAHAPTGLGKTAVALTAALERTMGQDGFTFYLTARQSQHNIAVDTSRYIWRKNRVRLVDIISREDSCLCSKKNERPPCLESKDCYFLDADRIETAAARLLDYPLHVSEAQRLCMRLGACPYLAAMAALPSADIAVCDYNQVFNLDRQGLLGSTARPVENTIIIVDEAHNLPGRIMENGSSSLTRARANAAFKSIGHKQFKSAMRALLDFMDQAAFEPTRPLKREELDLVLSERSGMSTEELAEALETYYQGRMRHSVEDVLLFLQRWCSFDEQMLRYMDPSTGTLHCRFMEPGMISSAIFEKVRCALLMSGTLHPPEMFAELLGIKDSAACRRYSSPFPVENRNIMVMDNVTSRYENRDDEMYGRLASALAEASSAIPGNVAAFFPSYEMMGEIGKRLPDLGTSKRILRERREMAKAEKDALLLDLRRDRNGLLLATIGGSFAEGVDFPDNLLSGIVVIGLPLSPPSLESNEQMQRIGKRVGDRKAMMYVRIYPAVTKVLQAAGRAIRSETDRASIILLDDRYLGETVRKAFPDDFQMRRALDLTSELESFHSLQDDERATDEAEVAPGH